MSAIFFRGRAAITHLFAYVTAAFGDARCEHPLNGEVWQYMGTFDGVHQFRHRDLPADAAAQSNCSPGRTYYEVSRGVGTIRK